MSAQLRALAPAQPVEDAALLARICSGDAAAFELLMRRHNRRLYRVARSMLRDSAEAEDALQEAYLSAYHAMPGFRQDAALATWLTRIVVNECTARLRRSLRRHNIVPIVAAQSLTSEHDRDEYDWAIEERTPEQELARSELRQLLERHIDRLPQEFRSVFVMRAVEEMTVEETAECLGIPEPTVRTRHFRARAMLREALAADVQRAEQDVFGFDGERCDRIVAAVIARALHPPA